MRIQTVTGPSLVMALAAGCATPVATPVATPAQPSSAGNAVSTSAATASILENIQGDGPRYPDGEKCYDRPFHGPAIMAAARPNVVRIAVKGFGLEGWGTGFVMASPRADEILFVTNHHVVGGAEQISAILTTPSGKTSMMAGLEVVKEDHDNDLVIVRGARLPGYPKGMYLNPHGVQEGQDVAAIGYPNVKGSDPTITFEPGVVTARERRLDGQSYVQTNININPGNSGGPVVDACGTVVGIVRSFHKEAQRVSLIAPGSAVLGLYERYIGPQDNSDAHLKGRLATLEKSIKLQKMDQAAEIFGRQFLVKTLGPIFVQFLQGVETKESFYAAELKKMGTDYESATLADKAAVLKRLLPAEEYLAWYLGQAMSTGQMSIYEGLTYFLEGTPVLTAIFGELTGLQVIEILRESDQSARVRAEVTNMTGTRLFNFYMVFEWGEWHIARLECLNCRR